MFELTKIFFLNALNDRSTFRYVVGTTVGLGFSIAVILCTIGIMDGYSSNLKKFLKKAEGDISIISTDGFFKKESLEKLLKYPEAGKLAPVIQTEGFLIVDESSRGVLIKGVEARSFKDVTSLKMKIDKDSIVLGKKLADQLSLKIGNEVVIALANGNKKLANRPILKRFKISGIVEHGVSFKDSRFCYLELASLQSLLRVGERVNMGLISLKIGESGFKDSPAQYLEGVEKLGKKLKEELPFEFRAKPFWADFQYLLKAVEAEKFMIGLSLQLIVLVSIFNVIAFIFYMNEKHAKEVFLFKALGMNTHLFQRMWFLVIFMIWILGSLVSLLFVQVFNLMLKNLSIFQLPSDIYKISELVIKIGLPEYIMVFSGALIWLYLVSLPGLLKLRKTSILSGLRQEFS